MKKIFFFFVIFILAMYIFIESNTWETRVVKDVRDGAAFVVTKHSIHWDRLFHYIINMPKRLVEALRSLR